MSYLDSNPRLRAELRDAGRLGYGRFDGPEPVKEEEPDAIDEFKAWRDAGYESPTEVWQAEDR
jgi:hypothetical protein